MSVDLNDTYKQVEGKTKAVTTYNKVRKDYLAAKKSAEGAEGEFEEAKDKTVTQLNQLQKESGKKRFEREIKNQTDRLFDLLKLQSGSGSVDGGTSLETTKFLRQKYVESVNRVQSQVETIFVEEVKKLLGCDQQLKYGAQVVDIPIASIDLYKILYDSPESVSGQIHYETEPVVVQSAPFSMNRNLFDLIIQGVPYSTTHGVDYIGYSGQDLFDIEYIPTTEVYRVSLRNRLGGDNLVTDFVSDYYQTIKVLDMRALWTSVLNNILTIDYSISKKGIGQIQDEETFMIILKRILGLCFDDRQEIDVAGTSKVPELDGVDDAFFEMTDIDLRTIDQIENNARQGVVEFQDCTNVKLPVNNQGLYNNLRKIGDGLPAKNLDKLVNGIIDDIPNSPYWPKLESLKITINTSVIKEVPKAIMKSLLSPKVLLPLFVMMKALNQNLADNITSLKDFAKKFKRLVINVMSRIGALFVKVMYDLIIGDLKKLLKTITKDILGNKLQKVYRVIEQLISTASLVSQFVSDFRKCKNLIDSILNAIELALKTSPINVPAPLLVLAEFRSGFDDVRAYISVLEEYQRIGIPTGPMPDGSPNIALLAKYAEIVGVEKERDVNGVTKQIITAADVAQIASVGFVTKSGLVL
jgi:hypothetical protein